MPRSSDSTRPSLGIISRGPVNYRDLGKGNTDQSLLGIMSIPFKT